MSVSPLMTDTHGRLTEAVQARVLGIDGPIDYPILGAVCRELIVDESATVAFAVTSVTMIRDLFAVVARIIDLPLDEVVTGILRSWADNPEPV